MRVDISPKLKFSSYKQETNTSNRTSHSLFSSYVVTTVKYTKLSWGGSTACIKAKGKNTGFWSEKLLEKQPNWKAIAIKQIFRN